MNARHVHVPCTIHLHIYDGKQKEVVVVVVKPNFEAANAANWKDMAVCTLHSPVIYDIDESIYLWWSKAVAYIVLCKQFFFFDVWEN